jgi:hypothetical protein
LAFYHGEIHEANIIFSKLRSTDEIVYPAYGCYLFGGEIRVSESYILVQAVRPDFMVGENLPDSWSTILVFDRKDKNLASGLLLANPPVEIEYKSSFLFLNSTAYLVSAPFPSRVNLFTISSNSTQIRYNDVKNIKSENIFIIANNDFGSQKYVIHKDTLQRSYLLTSIFTGVSLGIALLAGVVEWAFVVKRRRVGEMYRSRGSQGSNLKESLAIDSSN